MPSQRPSQREEIASIKAMLGDMDEKLTKVCEFIDGNGRPGAKTRLTLLERSNKLKNRVLWVLFLTTMGIIGAVAQAALTK